MAKTALERKRESLERKRQASERLPDATAAFQAISFSEFYSEHDIEVMFNFDLAGLPPLEFGDDDEDPHSYSGEIEAGDDPEHGTYEGYHGAIGRAEITVTALLQAAQALAQLINTYKRDLIKTEQERLNGLAGEADADRRRELLAEMVKLDRLRERLDKNVRWTVPEWKLKGE